MVFLRFLGNKRDEKTKSYGKVLVKKEK